MKRIIVTMLDGTQECYKIVEDDFDVANWAKGREDYWHLLGIDFHHEEPIPSSQIHNVP